MFRVFILALITFRSTWSFATPLADQGWLAFGDMRGYFEPCGCDPEADLGGVLRQYAFFERERVINPKVLLFNLGNNLSPQDVENYKSPHILNALGRMKLDAYLLNELELKNLHTLKSYQAKLPLVLSNLKKPFDGVLARRNVRGVQVFGFVSPKTNANLRDANDALLAEWFKAKKNDEDAVLLFSGDAKDLRFFAASQKFKLIVSSNDADFSKVVGNEEKLNESLLIRMLPDIRKVPIGGQGVLRGGLAATKSAPLLKDLFNKSEEASKGLLGAPQKVITWLDKSYTGLSNALASIEKDYANAGKMRLSSLEESRLADLKDSKFVGAEACKSCHTSAYEVWKNSGHAHAFPTLQKINKTSDPECVSCHVVGFKEKGGFVSLKASPHLQNVQCENCHGARKDHIANPAIKPKLEIPAKNVCTTCHFGSHSSQFDFKTYWEKIKHVK